MFDNVLVFSDYVYCTLLIVKRLWVILKNPQNFLKKVLTWEQVGFRIYPR